MKAKDEYLTPSEIAKQYGVSPATVRGWEKKGTLRATKSVTGRRFFKRSEVERFFRERDPRSMLAKTEGGITDG